MALSQTIVIPAKAGTQHNKKDAASRLHFLSVWAPAFAGVTAAVTEMIDV